MLLNYRVPDRLLAPYLPAGFELDRVDDSAVCSLVGFRFLKTRLFGLIAVPRNTAFTEINLRFYVRPVGAACQNRGVVFIREIVPRRLIAWTARAIYGEPYVCRPMHHTISSSGTPSVLYGWSGPCGRCEISASAEGDAWLPPHDSAARFFTHHTWGYTRRGSSGAAAYRVEHPIWPLYACSRAEFTGDLRDVVASELAEAIAGPCDSAWLAAGSDVQVFPGQRL